MKENPERDLHRELRRQSDRLACAGTGICLFGVWSVLQAVMDTIQYRHEVPELPDVPEWTLYLIFIIMVAIVSAFIFAWHLYIGLSARSVALKGKNHIVYTIIAAISAVLIVHNDVIRTLNLKQSSETLDVFIVAVIVDFSLVLALIDVVISNAMVRRLRKMIRQQEAAAHES